MKQTNFPPPPPPAPVTIIVSNLVKVPIGCHVFSIEPHRGRDGPGDPIDHDVRQQLVQGELLSQFAVRVISVVALGPEIFFFFNYILSRTKRQQGHSKMTSCL